MSLLSHLFGRDVEMSVISFCDIPTCKSLDVTDWSLLMMCDSRYLNSDILVLDVNGIRYIARQIWFDMKLYIAPGKGVDSDHTRNRVVMLYHAVMTGGEECATATRILFEALGGESDHASDEWVVMSEDTTPVASPITPEDNAAQVITSNDIDIAIRSSIQNDLINILRIICTHNTLDPNSMNDALLFAIEHNRHKIVDYLCTLPDVDPTHSNNAAITDAIKYGHIECFKSLYSIDIVESTCNKCELIRIAIRRGHYNLFVYLCSLVSVGVKDTDGVIALQAFFVGISFGRLAMIIHLYNSVPIDVTVYDNRALRACVSYHQPKILAWLCTLKETDPSFGNNTLLLSAIRSGSCKMIEQLCKLECIDLSIDNSKTLSVAIKRGNLCIVRYLCGIESIRYLSSTQVPDHVAIITKSKAFKLKKYIPYILGITAMTVTCGVTYLFHRLLSSIV